MTVNLGSLVRDAAKLDPPELYELHREVSRLAQRARLADAGFRQKMDTNYAAARPIQAHNTRERKRCSVRGCTRFAYKATICRKHWDAVPHADKLGVYMAGVNAQLKATSKEYRRIAKIAQANA